MKNKIILTYADEPAAASERIVRLGDTVVLDTVEKMWAYGAAVKAPAVINDARLLELAAAIAIAVQPPVTPWFPPEVKPVRKGYYVARHPAWMRHCLTSLYWDGMNWSAMKDSFHTCYNQEWHWYGLSSPAK